MVTGICRVVRLLAIALLLHGFGAEAAAPPMRIDYAVRRLPAGDRYEITVDFVGDRSGVTVLRIPSEWASAQHAERGIEDLTLLTPDATLADTDEPQRRRVVHRPGAKLRIRYRLAQIAVGEPDVRWTTNYLPVIQPTYFEWIGTTAWVVPTADDAKVRVRVHFDGLPDDWSFASSFGLERAAVSYSGPLEGFREAIFIGGDFRLRSRSVRGGRLVTAVRGDWPFRDSELADRVATIVDGERAFWRDPSQHDFLVTLMPVGGGGPTARSFNGTGLRRSFATFITAVSTLDDLDFLFTHEYFHTWNASGLGRIPEPEALTYWFSEGFTDYYAHLLLLRWNMSKLEQYAAEFDSVLQSLATMRESHLPNADIGARFFTEPRTIGKLPYWRGMLIAAKWDAEIRASSGGRISLDDAMRSMLRENVRGNAVVDATRIARTMKASGVGDPAGDVDRFVERGETIALVDGTLTPCIRIDSVTEARFDPGFDSAATMKTRRLTGVDPDGAAYAAGLREGDLLRSIDMYHQADSVATVGVQDDGGDRVRKVSFLPVGKPIERQRATVRADLTPQQRAQCLQALQGRAAP